MPERPSAVSETHSASTRDSSRAPRKRLAHRYADPAQRWQAAQRQNAWMVLKEYQRRRRTRPLDERLKGLLLSWPLSSGWPLPYTKPEVRTWAACEERERRYGDGEYQTRETELLRVLIKVLAPALRALGQKREPALLDDVSKVVTRAAGEGMRVPVSDICSVVERGRDAAWRDQQRARGARQLRETAKAQARFARWLREAPWVLKHQDRLEISPELVAALEVETRPRSWAPLQLPLAGYQGRASPGGEKRPWEQIAGHRLLQLGLSREDAETIRRCCGLMERSRRHPSS